MRHQGWKTTTSAESRQEDRWDTSQRGQILDLVSFRRNAGGTVRSYQTRWWQAKLLVTPLVLRIVLLPQLPQLTTVLKT